MMRILSNNSRSLENYDLDSSLDRLSKSYPSLVEKISRLSEGEYLQLIYDRQKILIGVRKLKLHSPGGTAIAETNISVGGRGRVMYQGQSWSAYCEGEKDIISGESLLVLAQDRLTLIVTPF